MDTLISPRRRTLLQALAAAAAVAACGDPRSLALRPVREYRGEAMGSVYTLKLAGALAADAAEHARRAVHEALGAIDRTMSTHRADSELSRFNAHAATTPFELGDDTFAVFALARNMSVATRGAFDITVAPLVNAWGFGPGRRERIVAEPEVHALAQRVGWQMLELDANARTVRKARADLCADLSGIAKGYAVDKAAAALDALGIADYMIEAGGEVRVRGSNGAGQPWQIGIEEPDAVPQRPHYVVPLTDVAIATSGDYRIYFERDGRRYCHEIDPATGHPIANGMASVSIVAARCAVADALAKLIVLGPAGGVRGGAGARARGVLHRARRQGRRTHAIA